MTLLIYLIFFFFSFGQLGRISFWNQQINVYLYELVMAIVMGLLMVKIRPIRLIGQIRKKQLQPIGFFLLILLLSLIYRFWEFPFNVNLVSFLYWLRLFFYFFFFLSLSFWLEKQKKKIILSHGLIITTVLTIIFSYTQYFLYPNLRNLYYLGWDPHHYRAFGLFFDTTIVGIVYSILFFFWVHGEGIKQLRLIGLIGLIGLILLTYSRITYLSFLAGLVFYCFQKRWSKLIIPGVFFGFLMLISLIPKIPGESTNLKRLFTIEARIKDYQEGISFWLKQPIIGWGYNRIRFLRSVEDINHAGANFSSSFLTILVSSGVIGLIGLMGLVRWFFIKGNTLIKTLVLIVSISSLFDNIFLTNFILFLFLAIFILLVNPLSDS